MIMIQQLRDLLSVIAALSLTLPLVQTAQPSAPAPIPAPLRELPWGDINFLHTSDTHGWLAGHLQEPSYGADWGDYISFAHRLRDKARREGRDLLLIDTGDRVDGNGLYDADDPKGKHTRAIFAAADIDLLCIGNHELYRDAVAQRELSTVVPAFEDQYLASNVDVRDPQTNQSRPLAQRYKLFQTPVRGTRVAAFGFLFDFERNAAASSVQPVAKTIEEEWFQEAIRQEVDLFIVIGHVPARSQEFQLIYDAIRRTRWDTPIMFFAGHTHLRDYKIYDSKAHAMESGRYMETVGFQSISSVSKKPVFGRRYIDNNLYSYQHHAIANASTLQTARGRNVSASIAKARSELELDHRHGCVPHDLWVNRAPYPHNDSVFSWLEKNVFPSKITRKDRADRPRIIISNTGAMRFDLFKGPFTRDTTYILSPFTSESRYIPDVPFSIADRVLTILNTGGHVAQKDSLGTIPRTPTAQKVLKPKPALTPGYTTIDDAGEDGDDTIHSPIQFYAVPNCFEARVNVTETSVDLVYVDFIQPWILAALTFLGSGLKESDTAAYIAGKTITELITEWVEENWHC